MHDHTRNGGNGRGGFTDFLRSLVSGLPWSERAECSETLHVAPPRSGLLRIDNANGHTRLIGEERSDVEVSLCKMARAESAEQARLLAEEIRLVPRQEGEHLNLELDVPKRWHRRGRVDIEVRVPRELRVEVISSNGRICVRGMRGTVRAKSSNGGVRIEDVVGDIEVSTSNAKVSTQCTCGRLLARSSNGKIELEGHRGSVDAATSNGTIHCELEGMGREGALLATSNGRIVLDLPEEVDGDVDIRVDNGAIRTSRTFEGSARERSGRMRGTLGRGGIPIKLRASNGTISLR